MRESSLKYQTRCVAAYPDGQGFAVASVEGRVAMEYYSMGKEDQVGRRCDRAMQPRSSPAILAAASVRAVGHISHCVWHVRHVR